MILPNWLRIVLTILVFLGRGTALIKIFILLAISIIVSRILRRMSLAMGHTKKSSTSDITNAEKGKKVVDGTSTLIDDDADTK